MAMVTNVSVFSRLYGFVPVLSLYCYFPTAAIFCLRWFWCCGVRLFVLLVCLISIFVLAYDWYL